MLSLRALPLLAIALIIYNLIAFTGKSFADRLLGPLTMLRGGEFNFSWGDLVVLIAILTFFIEIIKSTFTGSAAILDHALSMVLFIVAGLE